jgi:hypothetical protein
MILLINSTTTICYTNVFSITHLVGRLWQTSNFAIVYLHVTTCQYHSFYPDQSCPEEFRTSYQSRPRACPLSAAIFATSNSQWRRSNKTWVKYQNKGLVNSLTADGKFIRCCIWRHNVTRGSVEEHHNTLLRTKSHKVRREPYLSFRLDIYKRTWRRNSFVTVLEQNCLKIWMTKAIIR